MRHIILYLATLGLLLQVNNIQADEKAEKLRLFNGKNLSNWTFFLTDKNAKMEDVWSVKDSILVCKGSPGGYLATKAKYESYKLVVEWRWPGKPGNSGVLMRITGKPTMLPNCAEAQLANGDAGAMYGFQGFKIDGDKARRFDAPKSAGGLRGLRKIKGNEKKPGEWNRFEITADGATVTINLNGQQVNQATGVDVRPGQIGLQSEGGEIHFRVVELTPINK